MTKTKRQLRAEAVKRLKMLDEHGGGSFEYAILGSGKMAWRYMDKRDALIDLLTDDDSTTESLSDGTDSREKLEADVREWCATFPTWNHAKEFRETVLGWLDRQAIITELEHYNRECNARAVMSREGEYEARIAELTNEINRLKVTLGGLYYENYFYRNRPSMFIDGERAEQFKRNFMANPQMRPELLRPNQQEFAILDEIPEEEL